MLPSACSALRTSRLHLSITAAALLTVIGLLAAAPAARAQTAAVAPSWKLLSPASSPPPRDIPAMAYNAANGTIVLFGGNSGGNVLGDTWVYNGTTWTQQFPANSPSARYGSTMAYDATNGNVVLFGGDGGAANPMSDTWTWNGTNWTQKSPATSPPARTYMSMAYDAARGNIVLFGGTNSTHSNVLADTWTWNGTTWTQKSPATSPPAREFFALAYDAATSNVVLFGGDNANSFTGTSNFSDTWTWNGTNWTLQSPANSPAARISPSMMYDPVPGNLVLYGGIASSSGGTIYSDTWVWNGSNWTLEPMSAPPAAREGAYSVFDTATNNVVMFGGYGYSIGFSSETWSYEIGGYTAYTSPVATAAALTPVNFTVVTSGTLPTFSTGNVLTQGATALDFTLGTGSTCTGAVTARQACTVYVAFTPRAPGQRLGAVNLLNSSGTVLATAYVSGLGTGPQATFTPGAISTVAGNGTATFAGDGGAATSASLNGTAASAVDAAGNLYIADQASNRIRKVAAATGFISTVAGSGAATFAGDGAAATSASLNSPTDVQVDGAGNLYIVDQQNQRIRKVTAATGFISTVAGNGASTFAGDGGPALSASLKTPVSVAVDGAGNLYIADYYNARIRKVTAATGTISTVAGTGTAAFAGDGGSATAASLNGPNDVAVDAAGNLYIADELSNRIRKVTADTGYISTVAGTGSAGFSGDGGLATSAALNSPAGVAVDAAGNLYIAEQTNRRIRKVTAASGYISTVAGNGASGFSASQDTGTTAATAAALSVANDVAVDGAGNLYIADYNNQRIRKVTATPAPLVFGDTAIGSTSAVQTVTVNNIGNADLSLSVPSSGQNPSLSSFFLLSNSSTCPLEYSSSSAGTLATGATCTEILSYKPTIAGAVTGNLLFTDNTLNATGSTQSIVMTGSTVSSLTLAVVGQNVPAGTSSITLEFTIGFGGNTIPTGTPTLTVNGSSTGVGTVSCTGKTGHRNCTATYSTSTLAVGTYTITATQPADSTYISPTTATGTLTITGTSGSHIAHPTTISQPVSQLLPNAVSSAERAGSAQTPLNINTPILLGASVE